jgi:hypothetical protein
MTTETRLTQSDSLDRFDQEWAKAFQFLVDELQFRRSPIDADTRIGEVRYTKRGIWIQVRHDVLDHDVVAHIVRCQLLRRQVTRVGWIEVAGEDLAGALSALASGVKREFERHES